MEDETLQASPASLLNAAKQRVILLGCGSYNPPTIMHLRMFEIARDHLHGLGVFDVVGGIMSPVHDAYGKRDLAPAKNRVEMLQLALKNNPWVRVSSWEALENETWSRTRKVIDHHQSHVNRVLNGDIVDPQPWMPTDLKKNGPPVICKLLCGADVLDSFNSPGIWRAEDMEFLAKEQGIIAVSRTGNDPMRSIHKSDHLYRNMRNVFVVTEWISNDISSSEIRRAWRRDLSIKYLVPDSVIQYMETESLYGPPHVYPDRII